MKTNIALIGFMGTGKTTVGRVLAKKLNKKFIDMDSLIENQAGKPIAKIFQQDGEIAFRELEIEVAKEISKNKNLIIACGGGVVLNKINIDRLKQEGIIFYLTTSPEEILKRTSHNMERPMINVADRASEIQRLLEFRQSFYERAADITIDTTKIGTSSVADEIIKKLKENENFSF